ncbi:MAG: hypothetical protein AB7F40_04295 [Victivallaceae bacterium]
MTIASWKKPTSWTSTGISWECLPVLAHPCKHGYALWSAIRERIVYLYGDDFASSDDTPDDLKVFDKFNPNMNSYRAECCMYNAISVLIPQFVNSSTNQMWTESEILARLGDSERIKPIPYYLQARWLYQSYRIVNLLRKWRVISMSWCDEASPYVDGGLETFNEDKAALVNNVGYNIAIIQPVSSGSDNQIIPSGGSLPDNILSYTCGRDGTDLGLFKLVFKCLAGQYSQTSGLTVGLFVDTSGSMNQSTIDPAFTEFKEWIATEYHYDIVQRNASDERWLQWTAEYLKDLKFDFQADED